MTDEPGEPKAPMKKRWWRDARVIVGVSVAAGAFFLDWLLFMDSSPLHSYLMWHVGASNLWMQLNLIPYIISGILSGNMHGPSEIAGVIARFGYWFGIGFFVTHLFIGARAMLRDDR